MEVSVYKITKLFGCYPTFSINSYTARMSNYLHEKECEKKIEFSTPWQKFRAILYLTNHMLSRVILKSKSLRKWISFAAYWPFSYVIWPFIWRYRSGCITVFWVKATHRAGYSSTRTRLARWPFLPCWYGLLQIESDWIVWGVGDRKVVLCIWQKITYSWPQASHGTISLWTLHATF